MKIGIEHAWLLVLLALALLPWYGPGRPALAYPWLGLVPSDRLSDALDLCLRLLGSLAIGFIVLGLASPYRPEAAIERVGKGMQIVFLLDRSASMDMPFVTDARLSRVMGPGQGESKLSVARRLLAQFVAKRGDDQFAIVEFSDYPIHALDFTRKRDIVQAVIDSSRFGRGLGQTDMGRALVAALELYKGRPYTGSRTIMLASDGGAYLDDETRQRITRLMQRYRVGLYWLYIRSYGSEGLLADKDVSPELGEAVPEHFLHAFFKSIGTPYRAYEAEGPDALERAIGDIDRLENLPIRYTETLPRLDLSQSCFAVALACAALLAVAKSLAIKVWPG
jgi:mxaC protein